MSLRDAGILQPRRCVRCDEGYLVLALPGADGHGYLCPPCVAGSPGPRAVVRRYYTCAACGCGIEVHLRLALARRHDDDGVPWRCGECVARGRPARQGHGLGEKPLPGRGFG